MIKMTPTEKRLFLAELRADASVYGVPESYRAVIQDRIDLVNAKAERA